MFIRPEKYVVRKTSNLDLRHARSIFLQACLRCRVLSVNQGVDFFGRLVLVETGATELRSKTSAEFTSFVSISTGFVAVAKGARTPGNL